jgi:queuosine precursor transporter
MELTMTAFFFAAAMAAIVLASNVLVQFPLAGSLGGVALGDILTWGAFTYPAAFLVTDLANRALGPAIARRIVYAGFACAVAASILVPPLLFKAGLIGFETEAARLARIAMASGAAFLAGQLLDITLFNRLRRASWWKAPVIGSVAGSGVDTALFFSLAFAGTFLALGPSDEFASAAAPFLGFMAFETPRWVSWAAGDLAVKLLIAILAVIPYRLLMDRLGVWRTNAATAA